MLPDMVRQHLLRIGSRFHIQILQALDRLLIEIPGIEIDPSGNVFLNGKKVEQLLVMGQRYYGGDVKAALKNIPSRMVGSVRSFERNSDFGRLSGVAQNERFRQPFNNGRSRQHLPYSGILTFKYAARHWRFW